MPTRGPPALAFDASKTSLAPPNKVCRRCLKDYGEWRGVWKCKGRPMLWETPEVVRQEM
ncbi:uncharacterized protein LACBIDRAFT_300330 [Laccaria bicolor S238N-H82]|uniref:Predicted protein n=1 Tax=Laccaria bicolor (strain S238N-H82 / ATCC MYA-4686) TaxID=486041 RepID=B0DGI2_LACBS|nr:uncharacterized protein LACBIDRAFT_300330 [Laccaria bicolor S238N-H82]EDR06158.1 predicted protein [Laccaria bicolor S238N-H82]|eukprot:XP_001883019.1 predicted protein [Laccaria bicolor S238N-H82]